ncbi:putative RNA-dependent RNA polymerase 3 isoform X1 [Capsicum annuum]|uniref:probable RNA-dependent RNA polymerase 3 isoform X1 n=1 Tax=Capsicum annuum TaxID=4072 RepID=UPI001FB07A1E|nr:probable RNA-dependent RNA polymerase 3 isoform X1 [Capsicum annuum]XP_047252519.1 probable RNA-dependent RNA polymerase 3 isoform X1 [Capsicum annuum]XP_047252520.1 probable RNA-dependent RNA polymerase 3 isoform X1 [Capsicum annuum]XP_047252521.1 probable RNA-dependent RNA polymerase 3 isoform X1 [Capsicum annuum]
MQCRLFYNGLAVKGTLLVNRKLPRRTIQIRPSMIKVEADPRLSRAQIFKSLEINTPSLGILICRNTYLSRTLISLLTYGGVPVEYFFDILKNTLEETQRLHSDEVTALKGWFILQGLWFSGYQQCMHPSNFPHAGFL